MVSDPRPALCIVTNVSSGANLTPQERMTQCNAFIKERYDALDDTAKAELKAAVEEAKSDLLEKQADDSVCENVPVRDTPKAAQIKAIEKAQSEMGKLQAILQSYQMGVFVAYVPMNKDCAVQRPTCDRNSATLQAFFLDKDTSKTGSMLLRAKKYLRSLFISSE